MHLLHRRPLCGICFGFILANILTAVLAFAPMLIVLAIAGAVTLFLFLKKKKDPAKWGVIFVLALLTSLTIHIFSYDIPEQKISSLSEDTHSYVGRITDNTSFSSGQSITVQLLEIDGKMAFFKVSVFLINQEFETGDVISFKGEIFSLAESTENQLWAKASGILGEVEITEAPVKIKHRFSLFGLFQNLNDSLAKRLNQMTGNEDQGIFPALFLGNKDYLPAYGTAMFRRSGVSHLLAISGLHLTVLLAFLRKILLRAKAPRLWADILSLLFILLYTVLTGATASILRAAFMSSFYLLAWFCGRKNDGFTSLFLTGALLLLFSRGTVYDMGFWLSFFATFAILLSVHLPEKFQFNGFFSNRWQGRVGRRAAPFLDSLLQTLLITLFATLFTLPLCALFFGETSLVAIAATLLLSPLVNVILLLCFPLLLLSFFPYLGGIIGQFVSFLPKALMFLATWFGQLPFATVSVNYAPVIYLAIIFLLAIIAIPLLSRKWCKKLLALACTLLFTAIALVLALQIHTAKQDYLTFKESGGQDFLLLSDQKETILFDISAGKSKSANAALTLLKDKHITQIDALVLTHFHQGHSDFILRLAKGVLVQRMYLPSPLNEQEEIVLWELQSLAKEMEMDVVFYQREQQLSFGNTLFYLWESATLPQNSHSFFAMSFERGKEKLILASADYTYLPVSDFASKQFREANTLILSGHGGKPKAVGILPLSNATEYLVIPNLNIQFQISDQVQEHLSHTQVLQKAEFTLAFP